MNASSCLLATLVAILLAGCERPSPEIHYVFPNGYRGAFIIYTNRADGVELNCIRNKYVCVIPQSGTLQVKGSGPFYNWHTTTAAFADGTTMPHGYYYDQKLPPNVVAFWDGGARPDGMLYDFIGTPSEAAQFEKDTSAGPIVVGGIRKQN
jgi:hypothetical protein